MAGKPRNRRDIEQKMDTSTRKIYDRVLIVCEGKKTEPKYLRDLVDRCRLSNADVVIAGSGSEPRRVVATAKTLEKKERQIGNPYYVVYCVFDRDQHAHFDSASQEARDARLKLARSWPCFEYWLVLHFVYRRRPYARSGNRSAAQNCVRDLKKHLHDYTKGMAGVYHQLEDLLETAKSNAKRALSDAAATERPNPSTEVHRLVAYLQALQSGSERHPG